MIDEKKFYDFVRGNLFQGKMTGAQVNGMKLILAKWEKGKSLDLRWLAYMLATVYHETAKTMQAIEEYGHGKGKEYGKPHPVNGKIYYGRGLVQLTWYDNYKTMGKVLGVELLDKPELACDPTIAVDIMFVGMNNGMFTGVGLPKYFHDTHEDWINARRIINGTDCAEKIANYGKLFHQALKEATV